MNAIAPILQHPEQQFLDLLADILANGVVRADRTGTGAKSVFGRQIRFDLSQGFPVLTTKKLHLRSIIVELLWFLRGDTNVKYLQDNNCKIWDEWADENGDLGLEETVARGQRHLRNLARIPGGHDLAA